MLKIVFCTLAFIVVCFGFTNGQEQESHTTRIFYKLKESVHINDTKRCIPAHKSNAINHQLTSKYNINQIISPFYNCSNLLLKNTFFFNISDTIRINSLLDDLRSDSNVEYAEQEKLPKLHYITNDPFSKEEINGMGKYNWNWHLELINAYKAWDLTKGNSQIVVAVIDDAIWTEHPDLKENIVAEYDLAEEDSDASPPLDKSEWTHGTHTAGLVAATSDNNIGVSSIGYNTGIMALKAAEDNEGALTGIVEAIYYAVDNGADIINMSFGGESYNTLENVINYAHMNGVIMISSAGNDTSDNLHTSYPAAYENVIAVASVNSDDSRSTFSNYGDWVDVSAPGGKHSKTNAQIISTTTITASHPTSDIEEYGPTGYYNSFSGTSMSAPIASGMVALMLSINPYLSKDDIVKVISLTGKNLTSQKIGYRIDAYEAVKYISDHSGSNPYKLDFESSEDFFDVFAPWSAVDVDGAPTEPFTHAPDFPGEGKPMSFIAFNSSATSPGPTKKITPHDGLRFGACFTAQRPNNPNNDWLISPRLLMGNNTHLSFWAKSATHEYGLERFRIGISTYDNNPSSFSFISEGSYIEADTAWTKYTFNLTSLDNQYAYVAINCISDDAFVFMIDDIVVSTSTNNVPSKIERNSINIYPNPSNGSFTINTNSHNVNRIEIFTLSGDLVKSISNPNILEELNIFAANGVYIIKLNTVKGPIFKKLIINK